MQHDYANGSVAAITEGSILLRNLQMLHKVQRSAPPLPVVNPIPPQMDDRLSGAFTKHRKSMLSPFAPNRIASEWYPVSNPPMHEFVRGQNSRYLGRDPVVLN